MSPQILHEVLEKSKDHKNSQLKALDSQWPSVGDEHKLEYYLQTRQVLPRPPAAWPARSDGAQLPVALCRARANPHSRTPSVSVAHMR